MSEYMQQPPNFQSHTGKMATCPGLSEEQVIEAVQDYVRGECCFRDGFVKEMILKDIQVTPIYGYVLEFFLEKRIKEWKTEPYRGEYIQQESPFAIPVDIWSMPIPPPVRFGPATQTHTVPGSTSVVNCAQCTGIGNIQCGVCAGSMTSTCTQCNGSGTVVAQQDGVTSN